MKGNEDEDDASVLLLQGRPLQISITQARALFGIKKEKQEAKNIKEITFARVKELLPDYPWKMKKTGKPHEENYDIATSFIIAHEALRLWKQTALYNDKQLFESFRKLYLENEGKSQVIKAAKTQSSKEKEKGHTDGDEDEEEEDVKVAFQKEIQTLSYQFYNV